MKSLLGTILVALVGCGGGSSMPDLGADLGAATCDDRSPVLLCSSTPCCDYCQNIHEGDPCSGASPWCSYGLGAIHADCDVHCQADHTWHFVCGGDRNKDFSVTD